MDKNKDYLVDKDELALGIYSLLNEMSSFNETSYLSVADIQPSMEEDIYLAIDT